MSMNRTFVKVLMAASPNRAYLASCLQHFAKIPFRGTSDTLVTLGEMPQKEVISGSNRAIKTLSKVDFKV